MKIRTRILTVYAGFILLIGFVAFISISISEDLLESLIQSSSASLADQSMDQIDRNIYEKIMVWKEYSNSLLLQQYIISSNTEFEAMKDPQIFINEQDEVWRKTPKSNLTPFMISLIYNNMSEILREKIYFWEKELGYRVYGEVFLTNKFGANIIQTGKTSDYYQADEDWWQNAMKDGLFVSDVELDESAGLYSIDISIRTDDIYGNPIGVMKVVLNIEELGQIIESIQLFGIHKDTEHTDIMLVDKNNRLIYSRTQKGGFGEEVDSRHRQIYQNGEFINSSLWSDRVDIDGVTRIITHSYSKGYKIFKGLDWSIVIEQDVNEIFEIFKPFIRLREALLYFYFIIIFFTFVLGLYMSRSISRPINSMIHATRQIGKSKFDTKVEAGIDDELNELSIAIMKMSKALKSSRRELKKHESELEDKVEERTKQLDKKISELQKIRKDLLRLNKALSRANTELKSMDTYKNEFISVTAHELKTPLSSIHGFADLLQNEKILSNPQQRDYYLKIIMEDANRLKKLIDDILDLSRLDIGTMKFYFSDVKIEDIFKSLIRDTYTATAKKGLLISANVMGKIPIATLDKDRLLQVLANLVNNAVKYSPEKNSEITVSAQLKGSNILFSVKDEGVGISKKHIGKVFQRFYQADSSYTRKVGGTGLGLAICEGIVKAHGGKIWVESALGKGSTFYFLLPLKNKMKGKKEIKVFKEGDDSTTKKPTDNNKQDN